MGKKFVAGVDIGGTNSKIGIFDKNGALIRKALFETVANKSFDNFLERFASKFQELVLDDEILGMGIGAPNVNGLSGLMVNPPNLSWGTFNIKGRFQQKFSFPVFVDNDANIAAIGEKVWGQAKDLNNFIIVTLGTGVGTGVFVEGELLQSTFGGAAEGGHIVIVPGGRVCGCGGLGHLECYASASGIKRTIEEDLLEDISVKELGELLGKGDKRATKIFDKTADHLALGLAQMSAILYPERIILSGGVINAGHRFLELVRAHFDNYCFDAFKGNIEIGFSNLTGTDGAILGASSLASYYEVK